MAEHGLDELGSG